MLDKPDAVALLEAVESFLQNEAVPALEGSTRFRALVAANVVRIALRELRLGAGLLERECIELAKLLDRPLPLAFQATEPLARELNAELCSRIRAGQADEGPFRRRVLDYLRGAVSDKLTIDNPKVGSRRD
jgi:hypothetical protein